MHIHSNTEKQRYHSVFWSRMERETWMQRKTSKQVIFILNTWNSRVRPPWLDAGALKGSRSNGTCLKVTLCWGFSLQAELSQGAAAGQETHSAAAMSSLLVPRMAQGGQQHCQLGRSCKGRRQLSVLSLLPPSSFLIFALSLFCFCCLTVLLESLAMATPAGEGRAHHPQALPVLKR